MKERPILMSAPMVRALLRNVDPKTQTRRIAKTGSVKASGGSLDDEWLPVPGRPRECVLIRRNGESVRPPFEEIARASPYGRPGDRLWVRETWCLASEEHNGPEDRPDALPLSPEGRWCYYAATEPNVEHVNSEVRSPWRPSIHMPRKASRITLEVTGVRVQRLQDISEEDARAEGVARISEHCFNATDIETLCGATARQGFEALWKHINGPESWAANPYVWVIAFKRLEQKDGQP